MIDQSNLISITKMKTLNAPFFRTALVATAASFLAITSFAQQTPPEPLLPEVAQIVAVPEPLDMNILKQDVYIGLLAINAPEGIDYMQIGAQATYANQARLQHVLTTRNNQASNDKFAEPSDYYDKGKRWDVDMSVDRKTYRFACIDLNNRDCVSQSLRSDRATIISLNEKNRALMKRYLDITKLPYYSKKTITIATALQTPLSHINLLLSYPPSD